MQEKIRYEGSPRERKQKSPQQALSALMRYCSRAERSSGDALRLMRGWGVADADAREVLARLQKERFIDDRRYAEAFVRDKSRLAGWGPYKITTGLRRKGVAQDIIAAAVAGIETDVSEERLRIMLERKAAGMKPGETVYQRKGKLMRLALSRGFAYETAEKICGEILRNEKDAEEDF